MRVFQVVVASSVHLGTELFNLCFSDAQGAVPLVTAVVFLQRQEHCAGNPNLHNALFLPKDRGIEASLTSLVALKSVADKLQHVALCAEECVCICCRVCVQETGYDIFNAEQMRISSAFLYGNF